MTLAKILVLSDLHYPNTEGEEILGIIAKEMPDKLVILGDCVQEARYAREFSELLQSSSCKDFVLIKGDGDDPIHALKSLNLNLNGREFIFIHGHQYNLLSEVITKDVASTLKKLNKYLPVLAYATFSRIRLRNRSTYLILGHSHALKFYPRLRVACAGCLTTRKNIYNDRGYIIITAENDKDVQLCINRFEGERSVYEI